MLLYELDASHLVWLPRRAVVKDALPKEASRVDRPVPILSGRFRPCQRELFSGIRPSLFSLQDFPKSSSSNFAHRSRRSRRGGRPFPQAEVGLFCTILVQSKPFRCNTSEPPPMCCKQRTCATPKSFRCNIYKKHRGWGADVTLELYLQSLLPYLVTSLLPLTLFGGPHSGVN
jgi:hypothetical protein